MNNTLFLVIEGADGAGKSTQINMLHARLLNAGHNPICIKEPGGTEAGESIRSILKNPDITMSSLTELFLMAASRAQLVKEVIAPCFGGDRDYIILCDRYYHSTIAYQGFGRGLPLDTCWAVVKAAVQGIMPTRTFWLDTPQEISNSRLAERLGADKRFEADIRFQNRVRLGYQKLWEDGCGLEKIDGNQTVEAVHENIWSSVSQLL